MIEGRQTKSHLNRKLKMGMIGGGPDGFIGEVHRKAARMDGKIEIVAGAFSSKPDKSAQTGQDLFLDPGRVYNNYQSMIENELKLPTEERIDFVTIAAPNNLHFPASKAFLEAGFHVVCEKPMTFNYEEAVELKKIVEKTGLVFAVTYNYTGFPLVKHARHMVHTGQLGKIIKIVVEYPQDWLITKLEDMGQKQAMWRTDPDVAGAGGCLGDIGTHCENLAAYITGLEIEEVCADLTTFMPGRRLDDDINILLRYNNGARGILTASQMCAGNENNIKIRVYGEKGSINWIQENPNYLYYYKANEPIQTLRRANDYLCDAAKRATRIPTGHQEAFIEAFANIYNNVADTIRAKMLGDEPTELENDFPKVQDGLNGMAFIKTAIESNNSDLKWTKMIK